MSSEPAPSAERNRRLFDDLAPHRSLTLDVAEVVDPACTGREEGDEGLDPVRLL
jgi:hypothetical protein